MSLIIKDGSLHKTDEIRVDLCPLHRLLSYLDGICEGRVLSLAWLVCICVMKLAFDCCYHLMTFNEMHRS